MRVLVVFRGGVALVIVPFCSWRLLFYRRHLVKFLLLVVRKWPIGLHWMNRGHCWCRRIRYNSLLFPEVFRLRYCTLFRLVCLFNRLALTYIARRHLLLCSLNCCSLWHTWRLDRIGLICLIMLVLLGVWYHRQLPRPKTQAAIVHNHDHAFPNPITCSLWTILVNLMAIGRPYYYTFF